MYAAWLCRETYLSSACCCIALSPDAGWVKETFKQAPICKAIEHFATPAPILLLGLIVAVIISSLSRLQKPERV